MNELKRRVLLWLLAIIPVCPWLSAQEKILSLEQAKQLAVEYNKSMLNARLDVDIARKKVIETTAIGLPQVTAKADYQHIFKVPEFSFPMSGFTQSPLTFSGETPSGFYQEANTQVGGLNQYTYVGPGYPISPKDNTVFTLQVSQLIFSGEYLVGLQASKVYKTISEQALTKNTLEIGASVESTYYMALTLAGNLNIVKQNFGLMQQMLGQMEEMHKKGFLEDTEVDQLRVNQHMVNNLAISLEGQLKTVHNQLKYLMGMDMAQSLILTDKLEDVILSVNPFAANEFNPGQNIDYKMMENQVAAQKLMLKREQTTFLPTVAAFYQHQEKQKQPALDFQPKDVLGVSFSLPIFTSGSRLMKVKQAKMELQKANNNRDQLKDGLSLKFQSQKLNYETAYNTFLNQQKSKELSQKIYDKTTLKFKEGVSSSLDLTQVQSQYLSSVSNYYNAVLNLLNARVELQKLMQ